MLRSMLTNNRAREILLEYLRHWIPFAKFYMRNEEDKNRKQVNEESRSCSFIRVVFLFTFVHL